LSNKSVPHAAILLSVKILYINCSPSRIYS
jgi:hypothetical protein